MLLYEDLTGNIINSAIEVHKTLGRGFLEKVYENALVYELISRGMKVEQQKKMNVVYKGKIVGHYTADIIVEDKIVIELKTAVEISSIHKLQLLNYLKATNLKLGLLINFADDILKIKRVVN